MELPKIIELKNIIQKYSDRPNPVIENLNFVIEDKPDIGQFVVLLGNSGCGKSTLLRYISGLQSPTQGEVWINGKPRNKTDRISMVFQSYSSFPWLSVLDNVALGLTFQNINKEEREHKAIEMIKIVGLQGHESKYAKYPNLSGGQLQRVAIARSLLFNPQIILMDEPFGALDINTRLKMQDMLIDIYESKIVNPTIIFITHDISEAVYLAEDIYIMSANPGTIRHHMPLTHLPPNRNKQLKREKIFIDTVNQIEDLMTNL